MQRKYPELSKINYSLPSFTPVVVPKFVPIPSIGNPDLGVEGMALNYSKEYEKSQKDMQDYLDAKRDRERRKQEAFSKKLVPEKSDGMTTSVTTNLKTQGALDLSEFDSINNDNISISPSKVDFKLLKEIMGVKDIDLSTQLPQPIPARSIATSQSSSLVSIGADIPYQRTLSETSSPPKIQTPSPSKKEYFSKLPELTQTIDSLLEMGFQERNVRIGMSLFHTDKELLDFLFMTQEFPRSFLEKIFWRAEITEIPDLLKKIASLSEMGFSLDQVVNALEEAKLNKDDALDILLRN